MNGTQFEWLFSQWYGPLCRVALRMMRDKDAAEDIVQEVFVKFWHKRESLSPDLDAKAYLYKAVYNASLNYLKIQKRERRPEKLPEAVASGSADGQMLHDETLRAVETGIEELPPACKDVFLLSRYEELSYKEIAQTLDISVKTVEAHISKALRILRKHLLPFLCIPLGLIWAVFKIF